MMLRALSASKPSRTAHQRATTTIIHTGQHYDARLSDAFFAEFKIPAPHFNLAVGSGSHAEQTARMLTGLESILSRRSADAVVVFGDTNTTLAGALAARKLKMPVIHVEAGLRSGDLSVPEEINRVTTDHLSDLLFCATPSCLADCVREGLGARAVHSGDVTFDCFRQSQSRAERLCITDRFGIAPGRAYYLATIHRAENTDVAERLREITAALGDFPHPVLFPSHPRTSRALQRFRIKLPKNVTMCDPLGYLEMASLLSKATAVLTDSSGLQREAFFWRKPCMVLRSQREWTETLDSGWSVICDASRSRILHATAAFRDSPAKKIDESWFGNGRAAASIVEAIMRWKSGRSQ
jgi:UDP-N-acetylglucosamine 2-epimerase